MNSCSRIRWSTGLTAALILMLGVTAVDAQTSYRATPHEARWIHFEGRTGCHLIHELPGHALALLSHRTDGREIISLFFRHPPRSVQPGDLYLANPPWAGERRSHIEPVRLHPHERTVRFSQRTTRRIIDGLREGREPLIRYPNWYSDETIHVALTPAQFQGAFRAYGNCVDRQQRTDLGTATRGAVIPGATGEALADAEAGGEWEGDLPRLPHGPRTEVYFASGSAGLTRDGLDRIRSFVRDLEDNPHWGVVLSIGYADSRGDLEINRDLARERAERVRDELVRMGVREDRIEVETRVTPQQEPEPDALSLAENRRVELRTAL